MDVITLEEAKGFIQIGGDLADTTVNLVGDGAEQFIANYTGVYWTETEVTETLPGGGQNLWPNHGPIVSVDSVYTTEDGSVTDSSLYKIIDNHHLNYDYGRWPEGQRYWSVDYTAGYGDTYSVPADLKMAILQLCGRWFENRRGAESEDAAGHSISFLDLLDTDIEYILESHSYGEPA